jgi:hypothetical protein
MLELLSADLSVGVIGWVDEPVASKHSVLALLSLTGL